MEADKKRFEQSVQTAKSQMTWFKKNFNEDSFGRATNSAVMTILAALRPLFMTESCMANCSHPVVTIVGTRMIWATQGAKKEEFVEILLFDFRSMKFLFEQMRLREAIPFFMTASILASAGGMPVPASAAEVTLEELHGLGITPMWIVSSLDKGVDQASFTMEAAAATQQPAEA